jgi:hypothetical protein
MLIMVLLLLSLNAHAKGVIAEVINDSGGSIALTDMKCTTIAGTFIAYSYAKNGQSILGCWSSDDTRVFVRWSDGDLRSYPIELFNLKQKKNYL